MSILRKNVDPEWFLPLTAVEFEIMLSLCDEDRHGYAIMQEVEARTKGSMVLRPGTLYRAISRLLDNDLVEELSSVRGGGDDQRRRYYRLTATGKKVAVLEARRLANQVRFARSRKLLRNES
jgi:DNA-binding PadR family transcriptional regulator